ncbi:hypothetical protein Nmel_009816 [Mimus melanotis]
MASDLRSWICRKLKQQRPPSSSQVICPLIPCITSRSSAQLMKLNIELFSTQTFSKTTKKTHFKKTVLSGVLKET